MRIKNIFLLFLLFSIGAKAQLNNSWIDYSKTYYKFKIAQNKLCRIYYPTLQAAGLGNVNVKDFQLWRNGEQVLLYTSVSNGFLDASGYIEFYGQMNDGKPDKQLYLDQSFQIADQYSLETDTAAYFLTVNTTSSNLRFKDTSLVISSPFNFEEYCMKREHFFYKEKLNRGYYRDNYKEEIYSASYDQAEGWTSNNIEGTNTLQHTFSGLHPYTTGTVNTFQFSVSLAGNTPNSSRSISVTLTPNNTPIGNNIALPGFSGKKDLLYQGLPLSILQNSQDLLVSIQNNTTDINDKFVVASMGLLYPSLFNGNNASSFDFELWPNTNTGNRYLSFDNFNYGNTTPVLYDITKGYRYVAQINTGSNRLQFAVLPVTSSSKYMLMSTADINTIGSLETRNFINLKQVAQQGDYLIISNPSLNVNHAVDNYRDYRSSISGGNFKATIYYVNELTDQFGFGIKNHPAAIRDFVQFANDSFATKPLYVFVIGRGVNYIDYYSNQSNPIANQLNHVPTFGWPASDILLAARPGTFKPLIPIGRIGAVSAAEVEGYLQKMREYESEQKNATLGIGNQLWMKNIAHIIGGRDQSDYSAFFNYMNFYKGIAEKVKFGAHVETFTKTSNATVQQLGGNRIKELIESGVSFIGYFGHSSNVTLEYNLNDPDAYNNSGKYPFFQVSGCSAGNFFTYDPARLSAPNTIIEKYVLSTNKGSIGFLASTHFGIGNYLDAYNKPFYNAFCNNFYGSTIGKQLAYVYQIDNNTSDYYNRIHLEEIVLHGDPALKINAFEKPDYLIDDKSIAIAPSTITLKDNINIDVQIFNAGMAVADSMHVSIRHRYPNGTDRIIVDTLIPSVKYTEIIKRSISIDLNNAPKGVNKIIVDLDDTRRIDELNENNNSYTKEFLIYEDELTPVMPQNYSIVNKPITTFYASTSNPICGQRTYLLEIDTSELFNSAFPYKQRYENTGLQQGGLIGFNNISMNFTDSTVYYWRVAIQPISGDSTIWNTSSFVYLPRDSSGYNQSHYYQFKRSIFNQMSLEDDRKFKFKQEPHSLELQTGLYPAHNYGDIQVNFDGQKIEFYGCHDNNLQDWNYLQFYVFDPITLKPWENYSDQSNPISPGRFGSRHVCNGDGPGSRIFFQYNYNRKSSRDSAMYFIDAIPNGMYVAVTNFSSSENTTSFVDEWKLDRNINGVGNTLYDKLFTGGFTKIDSFTKRLPFLYFFQKSTPSFIPYQEIGTDTATYISHAFPLKSTYTQGQLTSPLYGPAKAWKSLHWRGDNFDPNINGDTTLVKVWGRRFTGDTLTLLRLINPSLDTSLAFIDANVYPYLQLGFLVKDSTFYTPTQLRYLRVNADYLPEGAIAPSILFHSKDTLSQGENFNFSVAFKNISEIAFDSMLKVKVVIIQQNQNPDTLFIPKRKIIQAGDTLIVSYNIDTRKYLGKIRMIVDCNPDNDQREVTHFNNFIWKEFYVIKDKYAPLLDVTFDGVHILNGDYVSASPHIVIKLKDENKYMPLTNPEGIKVNLIYGRDKSEHKFTTNDTSVFKFIPAGLANGDNTATVELNPQNLEDDDYELRVSGRDSIGNQAGLQNSGIGVGDTSSSIFFKVYNKASISNVFNYPNPFTTSTAFVFVLTGAEVPQNIRIQIMTITGKIVKEINKDELGPIRVGQNITDYKWDGTDMFGQPLANGVYLYRVLTNLNGKRLDKFSATPNDRYTSKGYGGTDKYFTSGYGKMYLMR